MPLPSRQSTIQPLLVEPVTLVGDLAYPHAHDIVPPAKRLMLPWRLVDPDRPAGATLGEAVGGLRLCTAAARSTDRVSFISVNLSAPKRPASAVNRAGFAGGSNS
jgi:hypothetical protein